MTDVGDGTYTYSFMVQFDGALTMIIKLIDASGVYAEWYPNTSFTSPTQKVNVTENMNFSDQGINWVNLPNGNDYFTATFYFTLKPTETNTYTLKMYHDDGVKTVIDGVTWFDELFSYTTNTKTKIMVLNAGQSYSFVINFYEISGGGIIHLYWSSSTIAETIIPASFFSYTKKVASSAYQITVS